MLELKTGLSLLALILALIASGAPWRRSSIPALGWWLVAFVGYGVGLEELVRVAQETSMESREVLFRVVRSSAMFGLASIAVRALYENRKMKRIGDPQE